MSLKSIGIFTSFRTLVSAVALLYFCLAGVGFLIAKEGSLASLGLPPAQPTTAARIAELGRKLFSDKRLSATGQMACATCHDPRDGFTQTSRRTPQGRDGQALRRNAPTLLNVAFAMPLMHDGAAPSLEAQALTPLFAPDEMANASFEDLERRLSSLPEYDSAFKRLFGRAPAMSDVGRSLAAYQRTLISGGSPFDRWKFGGDKSAMTEDAKAGFELFGGKAGCSTCHVIGNDTALLTDNLMHNTGVGARLHEDVSRVRHESATVDFARAGDRGRNEVTGNADDLFKYRTPTLRNIAVTAPYMHDGSFATLEDVVRFYSRGGIANANLDPAIKPLSLSDGEVGALVAFLQSLTGSNVENLATDAVRDSPQPSSVP